MENKFIKSIIVLSLIITYQSVIGQGNPGFIGKKFAIGYSNQFCLVRSETLLSPPENSSLGQLLTNHDFFIEASKSKYRSIAFHLGYQKIPVIVGDYNNLSEDYVRQTIYFTDKPRDVTFSKSGVSDFRMLSLGLKFVFYNKNKTIAAPVGIGHYLRVDAYFNKALNNYYKYTPTYSEELTETQKAFASKKIDRQLDDSKSKAISFGYGIESKYPITKSVFFKLYGEMNVTLNVINVLGGFYYSAETNSVGEDLKRTSRSIPDFRNMFLFGMGVGMLL